MAKGRGPVVAWSASVATLAFAFAAYVATQVKLPLRNPLFILLAAVAALAFLILIAAGLPDLYAWLGSLKDLGPPRPLNTRRWEYTADGRRGDLSPITANFAATDDLAGTSYMWPRETRPPWVRFQTLVACTDVYPSDEGLRDRFGAFLQRPPVMSLVESLTGVPEDYRWIHWPEAGHGLEAVLAPAEKHDGVASARLVLPWGIKPDWRERHCAILILQIVPRDESGRPAPPSVPIAWAERIFLALLLPRALAAFVSLELGSRVTGDPPAMLAVHMEARDMTKMVDTTGLDKVPGGKPWSQAFGYFIATPFLGVSPRAATNEMLRHMLRYALSVDV